jgi:hypothetical protein
MEYFYADILKVEAGELTGYSEYAESVGLIVKTGG